MLKNSAEIFPRRKFIPEEFKNEESSFGCHCRVIGVGTLFRDRRLRIAGKCKSDRRKTDGRKLCLCCERG